MLRAHHHTRPALRCSPHGADAPSRRREIKKEPRLHCCNRGSRSVATTYSPTWWCSTIGAAGLNFSVRDGMRWCPGALTATVYLERDAECEPGFRPTRPLPVSFITRKGFGQLVQVSFDIAVFTLPAYRRGSLPRPYNGSLILETASRLDAFSAYPDRTWIPGGAAGAATGKPEVRPTRSSRTKVRPPQTSCAHNR